MTVLVTGGTGFVGAHVAHLFAERGFDALCFDVTPRSIEFLKEFPRRIRVVKGDLLDTKQLQETVGKDDVEGIVHTAAIMSERDVRNNPALASRVNVEGTVNVLEAARLHDLKVIYLSTAGVYGKRQDTRPVNEDDQVFPEGLYHAMKIGGEHLVAVYHNVYGVDTVSVRISWAYGSETRYKIAGVDNPVYYFLENAACGKPIEWSCGGDNSFDFTYVKDVANGIFLTYTVRPIEHRLFNIGTGTLCKVNDIVKIAKSIFPQASIKVGPGTREGFPVRGPCDISRARRELGYQPLYSLQKGIGEYAEWIRAQNALG